MVLKKLWNILLLSNGISTKADSPGRDKWAEFRAEREKWEREHAAADRPAQNHPARNDNEPDHRPGSSSH